MFFNQFERAKERDRFLPGELSPTTLGARGLWDGWRPSSSPWNAPLTLRRVIGLEFDRKGRREGRLRLTIVVLTVPRARSCSAIGKEDEEDDDYVCRVDILSKWIVSSSSLTGDVTIPLWSSDGRLNKHGARVCVCVDFHLLEQSICIISRGILGVG